MTVSDPARRATLRDVAERAGVSLKTVSRVINDLDHVRPHLRERVQRAIDELGYRPDPVARSLRRGRDDVIGVVAEYLADPFYAGMIEAIHDVARRRGVTVMISCVGDRPERERRIVEDLLRRHVAGLILVPVGDDHGYLRAVQTRTPVVFADRPAHNLDGDTVLVDDHGASQLATRHLIASGHRRIAFVGTSGDIHTTRQRLLGYRQALADMGIAEDPALVLLNCTGADEAAAAAIHLLTLDDPPTAVFSSNARCSIGLVAALHRHRRTEIAMVSFGDFPVADAVVPPITVIDQDPVAIGRASAERLFARLDRSASELTTTIVPVRLIARGSGELPTPANRAATNARARHQLEGDRP